MRLAGLILALAASAAAQDYFPLQVGNLWTYRAGGRFTGEVQSVEAVEARDFGGVTYTLLRGWFGDVWLRMADDGALYSYDPAANSEKLWTSFSAARFTSEVPPCRQPARIASHEAKYSGPIGDFTNALQIDYSPGSCADAGIEQDLYLPWVGLVQRRVTTIAGPRTYDLVYARLGVTEISAPEIAFTLSLDRAVYDGNLMMARLSLRNTQSTPLRLDFLTGQRYDLVVRDEKNNTVYQWSHGKFFTQIIGTEAVQGQRTWMIMVPLDQIPNGRYSAEAWLTGTGPRFAASAGFEVRRPQ